MSGRAAVATLLALALVYAAIAGRFVHDALIGDEIAFALAAENLALTGRPVTWAPAGVEAYAGLAGARPAAQPEYALWHPPAYVYALGAAFTLAGAGAAQARVVGMLAFLLAMVGVYRLALAVFEDREDRRTVAVLAAGLFALNPLAVQGSLVLDIDNTVLTAGLALALPGVVVRLRRDTLAADVALGLTLAALLWLKLTTPAALLAAMVLWLAWRDGVAAALRRGGQIGLVAAVTFGLTWMAWTRLAMLPVMAPLTHLRIALVQRAGAGEGAAVEIVTTALRLALWMSPFLLALWTLALARRVRAVRGGDPVRSADLLHLFAGMVLAGYLLVGRTTFSFPRYHCVMLAPVAVIVAGAIPPLRAWRRGWRPLAIAGVAAAAAFWLAGDPLHATYTTVRERLAAGAALGDVSARIVAQAALVVVAPLVLAWIAGRGALARALAVCLLAWIAALHALQAAAPYQVRYGYGGQGTADVVARLARLPADALVIAPAELLAAAGNRGSPHPAAAVWTSETAMVGALSAPDVRAVVYGLPTHTLAQMRFFAGNARVRALLEHRFEPAVVGSYTVWSAHVGR